MIQHLSKMLIIYDIFWYIFNIHISSVLTLAYQDMNIIILLTIASVANVINMFSHVYRYR